MGDYPKDSAPVTASTTATPHCKCVHHRKEQTSGLYGLGLIIARLQEPLRVHVGGYGTLLPDEIDFSDHYRGYGLRHKLQGVNVISETSTRSMSFQLTRLSRNASNLQESSHQQHHDSTTMLGA